MDVAGLNRLRGKLFLNRRGLALAGLAFVFAGQSSTDALGLPFLEPTNLRCSFTSGSFTNLGRTSSNIPTWKFDLRLDRKNKKVLYRGAQLVDASYGAGHAQFSFLAMGDRHKMLLDLQSLCFTQTYSDEVSSLLREGKCRRI